MPSTATDITDWLARVRHDLVKRLVWPARDRRDAGGVPAPGELKARLVDHEGRETTAAELYVQLIADRPVGLDVAPFEEAFIHALGSAARGDVAGVLALEAAFDEMAAAGQVLARSLEGSDRRKD